MLEPPITYQGALKILGAYDRPRFDQLSAVLGGVIISAPVTATLGPLAGLMAAWSWIDQKNEAISLVRRLLDRVSRQLTDIDGYERYQLLVAAHTTLVITAYFEALREEMGDDAYAQLELTKREKERLTLERWREKGEPLISALYGTAVPAPSAACGFEENCENVKSWMSSLSLRVQHFLEGLSAWSQRPQSRHRRYPWGEVVKRGVKRYRDHYRRLAARVPEFLVWASFTEHSSTRTSIRRVRDEIVAAMDQHHTTALSRMERVLSLATTQPDLDMERESLRALWRAHRSGLTEPLVPAAAQSQDDRLAFPTVEQIYLVPRYRLDRFEHSQSRPWDEEWWRGKTPYDDLDVRLAAFATAPDSMTRPMLVLGHPGAGKSMLTKVLAGKLPPTRYTVVRVPLRHVGSDAPLYEQVEEALHLTTHGRVTWSTLTHESRETVRILILDGLDELLQASRSQRTGYLQEIVEFQRIEAAQERPIAVLVTSRTVVSDRVRIPEGTVVVRLEEFNKAQVNEWLRVWASVNKTAIGDGKVRVLDARSALAYHELARQPLLLLMLTIYSADPTSPALDAGLSAAALYRQILHRFAEREVRKSLSAAVTDVAEEKVSELLWRLAIAALAMFNRGQQSIAEDDLSADLSALLKIPSSDDLGMRVISQFFFVHTSESDAGRPREERRNYEFLHATFGEYLVASHIVEEVARLAEIPLDRRGRLEVDDSLLFALVSHQPLSNRASILDFAGQLLSEKEAESRKRIGNLLRMLLSSCRHRYGTARFSDYHPRPTDHIREIAAYSANLVLLRLLLAPRDHGVPVSELAAPEEMNWRSTVELWRAGLDTEAWSTLVRTVRLTGENLSIPSDNSASAPLDDVLHARLAGDRTAELRLRLGHAAFGELAVDPEDHDEDRWLAAAIAALVADGPDRSAIKDGLRNIPDISDHKRLAWCGQLMNALLRRDAHQRGYEGAKEIVAWVYGRHPGLKIHPEVATVVVARYPRLLMEVPGLNNPDNFVQGAIAELIIANGERAAGSEEERRALANLRVAIHARRLRRGHGGFAEPAKGSASRILSAASDISLEDRILEYLRSDPSAVASEVSEPFRASVQ